MITFEIPFLPPSSNNQYLLVKRGKKTYHVPTSELQKYKRDIAEMRYTMPHYLGNRDLIHSWISNRKMLCVNVLFYFEFTRVWTKLGKPKKMDCSNRLKALHDGIADLFDIDDCTFFAISAEKRIATSNEYAFVEIGPLGGLG